ncbi:MAG: DUF1501 domain-containing protein [Planctomycetaceae bacterium]|nr:DUF1501 domain-containing protein [Planctomycetaceae bacterium]
MLSRRAFMRLAATGFGVASLSQWLPLLADTAAADPKRIRSCILLWMPGGPSQLDTFDLKPEHENAGEFKPIQTSVPGIQISEHLPKLAQEMESCAIVRSMQTKEGDHGRATYHLRTGYRPQGPIQYPTLGSLVSKERGAATELPNYVSILPNSFLSPAAFSPGFLGPQHAPLVVGDGRGAPGNMDDNEYGRPLTVQNIRLANGIDLTRADARLDLLKFVETGFASNRPGLPTESHQAAYAQAVRMMRSSAIQAFELDSEPAESREAYGKNRFGQACLLARRLVEQGVPFVEVALGGPDGNSGVGWDTHQNNFEAVKGLSETLDPAWSTLISDLRSRGLLDSTLIVWMGEFGRTPVINGNTGRDHFPNAWSTVLCGGGIKGGQVYGATNESGMEVADSPVAVGGLLATVVNALGIDHTKQNLSSIGRPIPITELNSEPIGELLA